MAGVPKVLQKLAHKVGMAGPINWYPGHMASATRSIRERLRLIDLILEVRDSRVSRNSAFGFAFLILLSLLYAMDACVCGYE
jgi:hypothetical protein